MIWRQRGESQSCLTFEQHFYSYHGFIPLRASCSVSECTLYSLYFTCLHSALHINPICNLFLLHACRNAFNECLTIAIPIFTDLVSTGRNGRRLCTIVFFEPHLHKFAEGNFWLCMLRVLMLIVLNFARSSSHLGMWWHVQRLTSNIQHCNMTDSFIMLYCDYAATRCFIWNGEQNIGRKSPLRWKDKKWMNVSHPCFFTHIHAFNRLLDSFPVWPCSKD